jgi:hypothetical protein
MAILLPCDVSAHEGAVSGSGGLVLFPDSGIYPAYIADPHRAGFGAVLMSVSAVDIPDSGSSRYGLRMGGRLPLLGAGAATQPGGWRLNLDAGFNGQFDADRSDDNIGWDGIYGLTLAWVLHPDVQAKAGIMHWSSHVGDEYAERTGRRRINYTRGEWQAGIGWWFAPGWRTYGDYGYAYDMRNEDLQRRGRAQLGMEFDSTHGGRKERHGWYAALDVSATEEREWRRNRAVSAGFVVRSGERRWRLGIERYRGRPPIGEFFTATEAYTALGLWMEL